MTGQQGPAGVIPPRRKSKLHVPAASSRPGQVPDFSQLHIPPAGDASKPGLDVAALDTAALAHGLIRVLDDDGAATGR